jgi:hypothetical protein
LDGFFVALDVKEVATGCLDDRPVLITDCTFLVVVLALSPNRDLALDWLRFANFEALELHDYDEAGGDDQKQHAGGEDWVRGEVPMAITLFAASVFCWRITLLDAQVWGTKSLLLQQEW